MNIEHFKRTLQLIEANPNHLDMDTYIEEDPVCGTVGCFAGFAEWAAKIDGFKLPYRAACTVDGHTAPYAEVTVNTGDNAAAYLDLYGRQKHLLYYRGNWPNGMNEQYEKAKTGKQRVAVLKKRIKHFIKTGK